MPDKNSILLMMKDAILRVLPQSFQRIFGFSPGLQGQLCIGTFSELSMGVEN